MNQATISPENETAYYNWRREFLYNRLYLGIIIAIGILLSFLALGAYITPLEHIPTFWMSIIIHQCIALALCIVLLHLPLGKHYPAMVFLLFSWVMTLPFTWESVPLGAINLFFIPWTLTFLSQATLAPVYWQLHTISQLGLFAMIAFLYWGLGLPIIELRIQEQGTLPTEVLLLYLIWFCAISNIGIYLYEKLQRSEFKTHVKLEAEHQALKAEKAQSERLLLNILPAPIAERLKQTEEIIADTHPTVTIVFADIVRFTELSHRTSAPQLVSILNQVFSRFDELAVQHQLEKIKTIGDAYMAVSGLPNPCPQHVENAINFSLAMQQALTECNAQQNTQLDIRIGIHTGTVVAGVIGLTKFSYDLWGDSVNIASRMESHGIPGRIHVSGAVYEHAKKPEKYCFTAREAINVKGKGEMYTYWVDKAARSRV